MPAVRSLFVLALLAVPALAADDDFTDITPGAELAGWVVEGTREFTKDGAPTPVWTAQDGTLLCAGDGFGFIRYHRPMCDFIFRAEYRMSEDCNSGIGIRSVKYDGQVETRPSKAGIEIQIEDDAGKTPGDHTSMSLYTHLAATANPVKPAGEWNAVEVECRGPHIRVTLNGETVQDVDQTSVETLKDKPLCGYLLLQNHGHKVEFRKLALRVMKSPPEEANASKNAMLRLKLRSCIESAPGVWQEQLATEKLPAGKTAILICDLWDDHWCKNASQRCDAIARRMAPLIGQARDKGVYIIHCPSDTMDFYKDSPARQRAIAAPEAEPPVAIERWRFLDSSREAPLPIDDTGGGCDDAESVKPFIAWTRQHPAVRIDEGRDIVSDSGAEVYNYIQQQGIENVLYVGVHANMCVLGRSFGIRQMTLLGKKAVLVRDLTDAMYNPKSSPHVSHAEGTELVIQHVEKYWAPTVLSEEIEFAAAE